MQVNYKEKILDQMIIDRLVKVTMLKIEGKSCLDCSNCSSSVGNYEREIYCYSTLKMIDDGDGYGSSEVCYRFDEKAKSEFCENSLQEELAF
jgi:hypothetical protein